MSIDQQLVDLKSKSDKLNTLKIENATRLQALEQEKEKLVNEAKELGIDPAKIEEVLKQEEAAIQAEVATLELGINKVLEELKAIG